MIVDIIVGIVLFISALIAFVRGFIREVLTIAGVVGGLAAAYYAGPVLIPSFHEWLHVDPDPEKVTKLMGAIPMNFVADGLAYLCVFLVVVVTISIASHFLAEGVQSIGLGAVDRTFGVIFGLGRGVFLLGLFYLLPYFMVSKETRDEYFSGSKSQFYLEQAAAYLAGFLPSNTDEALQDGAKAIEGASDTRDRLQELNLLKKLEDGIQTPTVNPPSAGETGYKEPFRDEMNDMFRKQQEAEPLKPFNQQSE